MTGEDDRSIIGGSEGFGRTRLVLGEGVLPFAWFNPRIGSRSTAFVLRLGGLGTGWTDDVRMSVDDGAGLCGDLFFGNEEVRDGENERSNEERFDESSCVWSIEHA